MDTCDPFRLNRKSSSSGKIVNSLKPDMIFAMAAPYLCQPIGCLRRRKKMVTGKSIRGFVELGCTFHVELAAARAPGPEILVDELFEFPICLCRDLQTAVLIVDFRC